MPWARNVSFFKKREGRPVEKKENSVLSATNEHEECSQDGDRGHDDQGDTEQPITGLRGCGEGRLRGRPDARIRDHRGRGLYLVENDHSEGQYDSRDHKPDDRGDVGALCVDHALVLGILAQGPLACLSPGLDR